MFRQRLSNRRHPPHPPCCSLIHRRRSASIYAEDGAIHMANSDIHGRGSHVNGENACGCAGSAATHAFDMITLAVAKPTFLKPFCT
eukprot:2996864-Rhodomonas_salina.1